MLFNVTIPVKVLITASFIFLPFVIQLKGIIPGGTLPLIDILMLLIISISLLGKLNFDTKDLLPVFFMSFFCLFVLVSGMLGKDNIGYLEMSFQYFLSYVLFYLVLINNKSIFDEALTKVFLYSSSISVVLITLYYHLEIALLPDLLNYNSTGGSIFKRVGFTAVNDYGYILAASILSHLYISRKLSLADMLLICFLIYGILLTGSRSAMFFLISGLLILFFSSKRITLFYKSIFIIFFTTLAAFFIQLFAFENRIFQNFELASRLNFINALSPSNISFLGGDAANFKVDGVPVHINTVQILLSSGILAFIAYLLWYFSIIIRSYSKEVDCRSPKS